MEQLDVRKLLDESLEMVNESGSGGRIPHLYEDYKMTFNEMRQIFRNVFSGKTILTEKLDGMSILVTYKDGKFGFSRNKSTLKEPMDIEKLGNHFNGNPKLKEAYVRSANDMIKALNSIDAINLNKVFANGQNFANMEIVYPPVKHVFDYGNRCILQLNGIDCFDSSFNKVGVDESASKWLYETLKNHKALKQEMFEIEEPRILRMKDSVSGEKALAQILTEFDKVIDGYSTKDTIQDYANDRLRRYVINFCNHNNIEVDSNCQFVRELSDRICNFSGRRPTKSDICTFAKRAGVNVHSDDYKHLIEDLDLKRDQINEEIMRPIENLVMKAGILLLKNLTGFMSADPQKMSQRVVCELESAINEMEKDNSKLTVDKLKVFKRNVRKINEYQERFFPAEGVICKINGRTYKICGQFGPCNQILGILKYN